MLYASWEKRGLAAKSTFLILSALALAKFLVGGAVLALPSEVPDDTPMVDGRVRVIAQVGGNVWVGGSFSQVERRDGVVPEDVNNVAVFDVETGRYLDIAPKLGDNGSTVWDMDVYGDDVIIAGDFPGPGAAENNLVVVDGATGEVTRWYDSPPVRSALAAPELGRIYSGGRSLSAFDFRSAEKLWSRARVSMDQSLRSYEAGPGYRDLELDPDGSSIWAACGCDAVGDNPAKALVKLDAEGNHDPSWVSEAEPEAFGISVANQDGSVYLGAGGNDFLASYPKDGNGRQAWKRDTSGSTQVVEVMGGQLVVGGHFWEVADGAGDSCGHRSSDNAATLDPSYPNNIQYPNPDPSRPDDQCATRHGLAAYSFGGDLDPDWNPMLEGQYSLTWTLHPEVAPGTDTPTGRLYVGGSYLTVNGVEQTHYARLP